MKNPSLKYIKKNFDSLSIVTVLGKIAVTEQLTELSECEQAILSALRRSNNSLTESSTQDIQEYLANLDDSQVPGLVSNVKGILHEIEFVRLENEDGDDIYASFYKDTNHPDTDVQLIDQASGETWAVQLKATDSSHYVQEWIDEHPNGEILVTDELAKELELPSSGMENEELTSSVDVFVDKMVSADEGDVFWGYFPALTLASMSIVIWELWGRHRSGQLSKSEFQNLAARATGLKAAKFASIGVLLSIPVVGQVTGALLIANLLLGAREFIVH